MTKPNQRFEVGQRVMHLGTPKGYYKGEMFTIKGFGKHKLYSNGVNYKMVWAYKLNAVSKRGLGIGALEAWLAPVDDETDGVTMKEMMKTYTRPVKTSTLKA